MHFHLNRVFQLTLLFQFALNANAEEADQATDDTIIESEIASPSPEPTGQSVLDAQITDQKAPKPLAAPIVRTECNEIWYDQSGTLNPTKTWSSGNHHFIQPANHKGYFQTRISAGQNNLTYGFLSGTTKKESISYHFHNNQTLVIPLIDPQEVDKANKHINLSLNEESWSMLTNHKVLGSTLSVNGSTEEKIFSAKEQSDLQNFLQCLYGALHQKSDAQFAASGSSTVERGQNASAGSLGLSQSFKSQNNDSMRWFAGLGITTFPGQINNFSPDELTSFGVDFQADARLSSRIRTVFELQALRTNSLAQVLDDINSPFAFALPAFGVRLHQQRPEKRAGKLPFIGLGITREKIARLELGDEMATYWGTALTADFGSVKIRRAGKLTKHQWSLGTLLQPERFSDRVQLIASYKVFTGT